MGVNLEALPEAPDGDCAVDWITGAIRHVNFQTQSDSDWRPDRQMQDAQGAYPFSELVSKRMISFDTRWIVRYPSYSSRAVDGLGCLKQRRLGSARRQQRGQRPGADFN